MFKRFMSLLLAALLISLSGINPLSAFAQESNAKSAAKIREKVSKIGTGPRTKVEVKLRDGAKVKGYISEITNDHFTVVNKKTGEVQVLYAEAKSVHEDYLPKWMKVASYVMLGIFTPILVAGLVVVAQGGQ